MRRDSVAVGLHFDSNNEAANNPQQPLGFFFSRDWSESGGRGVADGLGWNFPLSTPALPGQSASHTAVEAWREATVHCTYQR